jgi:hypothetical protein
MQCIHQSKRELQRCFGPRFNLIFNHPKWFDQASRVEFCRPQWSTEQGQQGRCPHHEGNQWETTRETMVKPGKNSTVPQVAISMSCVYNVYSY